MKTSALWLPAVTAAVLNGVVAAWSWSVPATERVVSRPVAYQQHLSFDYLIHVLPTSIYPSTRVTAQDLMPCTPARNAAEPTCRRLATAVTEALEISTTYAVTLDQPGTFEGGLRWAATLSAPGYWERRFPLWASHQVSAEGKDLTVSDQFTVRLSDIVEIMETVKNETQLPSEQVELRLQPAGELQVSAAGRTFPVAPPGEMVIRFTGRKTAELPEKLAFTDGRTLQDVRRVPVAFRWFGLTVSLPMVRVVLTAAEAGLLFLTAVLYVTRRRQQPAPPVPGAVGVALAHLPEGSPVLLVTTAEELRRLAARVDKPILYDEQEQAYLLVDGNVVYKYVSRRTEVRHRLRTAAREKRAP